MMYFKNEQMHHLDEHFGDLENNIAGELTTPEFRSSMWDELTYVDREIEIIQDLVERLRVVDEKIMEVNDVIAELDW
jgi:hypothetical protein